MSEKLVTSAEAEQMLDDAEWGPWDFAADYGQVACEYGTVASDVDDHNALLIQSAPNLARTVIVQAAQIKRLRGVIRNLDAGRGGDLIGPLVDNGVLKAEDMEDTDE